FAVDRRGDLIARAPQFVEHMLICDVDPDGTGRTTQIAPLLETDEEIYAALVLGTRDYVTKNGFEHVVIGLSGGVDSTVVALVAVDALSADRVTCVTMPSRYSSEGTRGDAHALAANLGVELLELPIENARTAYDEMLAGTFNGREPDLTEENLQARIRGN